MAETISQFRSNLAPTKDGCIDAGYDVSSDHVTGSDDDSQKSPVVTPRGGSSGSASVSSCSSHETVVSVGARQPETRDRPHDVISTSEYDRNPEPEAVCCNGDPSTESGDEVFNSEMTAMSPLVNRWRRRQQAEIGNNSTSGPYLSWSNKSTSGLRSDPSFTDANSESRRGSSTHGYSSDTEAFLRTLNRRGTTSGQSVSVSGRCAGQSPSAELPAWYRGLTGNLHRTTSPTSAVKNLESPYKQQNGGSTAQSVRFASSTPAWNGGVSYPHRISGDSPSSKWAAAASVSDSRRTDVSFPFQKDRGLAAKSSSQRPTRSVDHPGQVDPRRAWVVQPTKKFDDTDEEAQSPMVTSHNGTAPGFPGISPLMTSSLCSTNSEELLAVSGVNDALSVRSRTSSVNMEERRMADVNRLRQDLKWAQDQLQLLTSRLSTNVSVVEAFDQTLCNMSRRLQRLTVSSCLTATEVSELQSSINALRRQNWSQLPDRAPLDLVDPVVIPVALNTTTATSSTTTSSTSTTSTFCRTSGVADRLRRQTSSESVSSATSAQSSISQRSNCTEPEQKHKTVRNWLRSSFGKAFSRKKRDTSVSRSNSIGSARVDPSMSHTWSMPTISDPTCVGQRYASEGRGSSSSVYSNDLTQQQLAFLDTSRTPAHQAALMFSRGFDRPTSPAYRSATGLPTMTSSMTSPRRADVRDELGQRTRAHKRSESLDQKLGLGRPQHRHAPADHVTAVDMATVSTGGRHVSVVVSVNSASNLHVVCQQSQVRKSDDFHIGNLCVSPSTAWSQLDALIRRMFQDYLRKLDPATNVGLSGDSIDYYTVGEVCRRKDDVDVPELLPYGYLVGDVTSVVVGLKGGREGAVDELSFELLIPKLILQRYVNLLLEHRRVILSGSSGTGKTYLARRLAEFIVQRSYDVERCSPAELISIFEVDSQSSRELRQYLNNLADQCSDVADDVTSGSVPAVVILDNLHRVTSFSDVFNGFLSIPHHCCPYVIGTMNQSSSSCHADLQMHHNFRWVLYANHIEPVRSFLGRYLRRQLAGCTGKTPAEVPGHGSGLMVVERVVEWLPKVWQRINRFLESHSSFDITIGPRLFLSCPMDFSDAEVWFTDLWNYSIVPYLLEAVRDEIQTRGCRGAWEELADWVTATYPWRSHTTSQPRHRDLPLLRLKPEDVGYAGVSSTSLADHVTQLAQVSPEVDEHADPLSSMIARLQQAALFCSDDHDTAAIPSHHGNAVA